MAISFDQSQRSVVPKRKRPNIGGGGVSSSASFTTSNIPNTQLKVDAPPPPPPAMQNYQQAASTAPPPVQQIYQQGAAAPTMQNYQQAASTPPPVQQTYQQGAATAPPAQQIYQQGATTAPPAQQVYQQGAATQVTSTADAVAEQLAPANQTYTQGASAPPAPPPVDEGALLSEVMAAIRNDPMGFSGGANLLNYRTSGGQSLNDLPQGVQDQINAFLGGGDYGTLLNMARDTDPGIQLQQLREEQQAREQAAQAEAAARAEREAASAAALAAQQAATPIQDSTAAIEQAATAPSDISNAGTFNAEIPLGAETVTAPTANQNTGLNAAILNQLGDTAALDLQSDDELRRNQQALLAELSNQAEAAGKSAVTDLTLPDLTAVSVPPRQMSAMEQAVDTRLTDRLTGGQFLDPQSALTNEAEAQALERLQQESFLGESAGLDSAERRAMARMAKGGSGVDIEGSLATSAEDIIRQRLLGGENPMMAAQRARVEERYGTSMDEGREMLNRLGVLRGGDTADVFNELTSGRDQQMLDVDAMGFDLQSQAIADALGYQGRRDSLGLANEELARAAISDVAGLAGQRDQRGMAEQGLRRQAISDTLPFQQRRDAIGLAEQDLQRAAISDALGRQGMIDDRDFAESQLTGSMRGAATLPARIAQAGLQFDAANLQQDVSDRTLARLLTQTEPTQRERFEEGVRASRFGEGLATRADLRAEEALQSDLFGEVAGRGSAPVRTTRGGEMDAFNRAMQRAGLMGTLDGEDTMQRQQLDDALLSAGLDRDLAGRADTRAAMTTQSGLATDRTNRRLAGTADTRAESALASDLLTAESQRGAMADDLVSAGLDRRLAQSQNQRAENLSQQDILNAISNRRLAGTADTRAESALTSDLLTATSQREAMADDLLSTDLDRRMAQSQNQRSENLSQQDILNAISNRRLAGSADTRAESALTSDLLTATSQREAMTDDLTTALLNRQLATSADSRAGQAQEAALFGEVAGSGSDPTVRSTLEGTLARSADERAQTAQDRAFENELITQLMTVFNDPNLAVSDPSMRIASILARRSGEVDEKLPQGTLEASDTLRRLGLTDDEVDMVNRGVSLEQIFRIREEG